MVAATLLGLALAGWVVRSVGWNGVVAAVARLGVTGFAALCCYSIGLFLVLGAAWASAADEPVRRAPLFGAARLVREAAADLLPFSQLGGLIAGARVLHGRRLPTARLYASMIADQATEMASQLVFTITGLAAAASLLAGGAGAALRPMVLGGTAVLTVTVLGFLLGQRRVVRFAAALARRVLPVAAGVIAEVEEELGRLYLHRRNIAASFGWNLLGWLGTAGASWLILRLIGAPLPLWRLVALESLIAVVRSVAFLVPGAIGVQEAAYALIGPLLGLPAGTAVAVSLAKRARDVALGVPALLAFQATQTAGLFRRRPRPAS